MTTLADLRAALRVLLNDIDPAAYLWLDGALNRYLDDAVRAYGRSFPREVVATVATVADQAEYDLPAGCERVLWVEAQSGSGAYGDTPLLEGGDAYGIGYELFGNKLVLMPEPAVAGDVLALRYLAAHATLAADGDVSTVPASDEDLLLCHAASQALQGLGIEEAKRQEIEQQGSTTGPGSCAAEFRELFERGVRVRASRLRLGRLVTRG